MAVYFWRLEDAMGDGVFGKVMPRMPEAIRFYERPNANPCSREHDPYRHPSPWKEGLTFNPDWFCGFASLRQYRLWFPTKAQREWLTSQGVVLKRYRVPREHFQRGQAQIVFRKAEAEHVASRKPNKG